MVKHTSNFIIIKMKKNKNFITLSQTIPIKVTITENIFSSNNN